jgi:hypothetical protein
MNISIAVETVGGLSSPSKMVVPSTGFNTNTCMKGSKLKLIKGSVCEDCYADKGFAKVFDKNVRPARHRRLEAIKDKAWVSSWIYIIKNKKVFQDEKVFRWQDSGDLQSKEHLDNIIAVATATPDVIHWLPTKESNLAKSLGGVYPSNLIIRLSGSMVDGKAPNFKHTSTVTTDITKVNCFASLPSTDSRWHEGCGECRNCWDSSIQDIAYYKH